jgi:DNA-binding protein H-NS
MTIDLNTLSARQLETLISQARKRKTKLGKRKPAASVRKKITALAKAEGYTIAELFGSATGAAAPKARKATTRKARKATGKVPPKYRNPANPVETWTGRGKQPRWMAAETAKGRKVEDFLIK